jgi:hypothetical protein
MAIQNILGKIFSNAGAKIVDSIGDAFDKNFTNKEEKIKMQAEIQKIVNQHMQEMTRLTNEQFKAEVEDRTSARNREVEFVKATGHIDWMQVFVGAICMISFAILLIYLLKFEVPVKNEHILINAVGILEGLVLSVASYYFGSSAGSRLKDQIRK